MSVDWEIFKIIEYFSKLKKIIMDKKWNCFINDWTKIGEWLKIMTFNFKSVLWNSKSKTVEINMHTMVLFKEFTSKLKGYLSNGVRMIMILARLEGDLCFGIKNQ